MVNGVNGISTIHVLPPKEVQKFEYDVEIDGKKQTANVVKLPSGEVLIRVNTGKKVETIVTDQKGLIEFNKKFMPKYNVYNTKSEKEDKDGQVDPSVYGQIMKNLAMASMLLANSRNNAWMQNQLINDMNMQVEQQNMMMNNMMMHQQAMQDHMTAVQMSTPGMGFI